MNLKRRKLTTGWTVFALTLSLIPHLSNAASDKGIATISVNVEGASPTVSFIFKGVISGAVGAGASISLAGLAPGAYTAWDSGATPGYELVSITCDDANSAGYTNTGTARFVIDKGETVTCAYLYREQKIDKQSATPKFVTPAAPPPKEAQTPKLAPEAEAHSPLTGNCPSPKLVPREGVWMVTNLPGTMVCGAMTMPLAASQEPGTLSLQNCGWTVVGSGFSDGSADLVMHADDSSGRHYSGTVGGAQDGIPMAINFRWNLETDSFITGTLHSQVSQQGMACTMSRPYEMRFTGG